MGKKHISASSKQQRAAYAAESRSAKNRLLKLARHLKKHPNDEQAKRGLKLEKPHRVKPRVKGNFPPEKWKIRDAAGHLLSVPRFAPSY